MQKNIKASDNNSHFSFHQGTDIRSAYYTGDAAYFTMSGTSMACPHAAGLFQYMYNSYMY